VLLLLLLSLWLLLLLLLLLVLLLLLSLWVLLFSPAPQAMHSEVAKLRRVQTCACMHACVCVFVCVRVSLFVHMCVHEYVCACVCVCVCVCVSLHVCKCHTPRTPTTAAPHIAHATPVALLQHYGRPSVNSSIPPGTVVCSGVAADLSCDSYGFPTVLNALLNAALGTVLNAVVS
jgi:hypothetical protein